MILYTCEPGAELAGGPGPFAHPCARATKALDAAGIAYDVKRVKGGSLKFWTLPRRAQDRAEVEQLSGQRAVPILVLDDGEVVSGSGSIAHWAGDHSQAS